MSSLPEPTINLLLSGLMGIFGGLVTIPINALVSHYLQRDLQQYRHRLDMIAKQRELLLQHRLEMERKGKADEIAELKAAIARLEQSVYRG